MQVACRIGVAATKMWPGSIVELNRERRELTNAPYIGSSSNAFYTSAQLNIAHAKDDDTGSFTHARRSHFRLVSFLPSSCAVTNDLYSDLAFFGGAHRDEGDQPGGLTTMIGDSDLPDDYIGGKGVAAGSG